MSLTNGWVPITNSAGLVAWGYPQLYNLASTSFSTNTTTSTSFTTLVNFVSPPAGTYLVHFSSSCTSNTASATVTLALFNGSSQVSYSTTTATPQNGGVAATAQQLPISTTALMVMNGSNNINLEWMTSSGTASLAGYRLFAVRIA